MDEAVKTSMKRGLPLIAALILAAGAASAASPLPDPTRPPAAAMPASAPLDAAKPEAAPQLQSVLLGAAGVRGRIAVIDGQSVRVGENFRGARVVRIADSEVELQRGRARQVLRLYAPESVGGMTRVSATVPRRGGEE